MTTEFWIDNPNVLLENCEIWPMPTMDSVQKYNAISRLIILLTICGYVASQSKQLLVSAIITLGLIVYINKKNKTESKKIDISEGFVNDDLYDVIKPNLDKSSENNPFSNVMMNSDKDKKIAPPCYNSNVKKEITNHVKSQIMENNSDNKDIAKLFRQVGDEQNFENSMRSFYSMPNTQIPNDEPGFAEFCYGSLAKK